MSPLLEGSAKTRLPSSARPQFSVCPLDSASSLPASVSGTRATSTPLSGIISIAAAPALSDLPMIGLSENRLASGDGGGDPSSPKILLSAACPRFISCGVGGAVNVSAETYFSIALIPAEDVPGAA